MAEPTTTPKRTPSANQVNALRADPSLQGFFDEAFGPGSAATFLAPPKDAQAEPKVESQGDIFDTAGDIIKGAARGAVSAVDEASDLVASGINKVAGTTIEPINYADYLDAPDTTAGGFAQGVGQFAAGFVGVGKFIKLKKLADAGLKGEAAVGAIKGAVTDFTFFDPHAAKLTNLIEDEFPAAKDEWYTYLAADKDDSEAEGRLKNVLEGLGIGATLEGVLYGARVMRAKTRGTPEDVEAAIDAVPPGDAARASDNADEAAQGGAGSARQGDAPKPEGAATDNALPEVPPLEKSLVDDITNEVIARDAVDAKTVEPFRLDKLMDTPAGALRMIGAVADRLTTHTEVPMADIVERAEALAKELSVSPERLMLGLSATNEPGRLAAEVLARQKVLDLAGRRADKALNDMLSATGTDAKLAQQVYHQSVEELRVVTEAARGARSEAGRTLRALREQSSASGELAAATAKMTPEKIAQLRLLTQGVTDPAARRRIILAHAAEPTGGEQAIKLWRNFILSGPATHLINGASNFYKLGSMYGEDFLAGVYRGDRTQAKAAAHGFVDAFADLGTAFRASGKVFVSGSGIIDPAARSVDVSSAASSSTKNLADIYAAVGEGSMWKAHLAAAKTLGGDFALRGLGTTDELFKQVAYNSRVRSRAWANGREQGLRGAALKVHIQRAMDDSIDPVTLKGIDEDAMAFSRDATFTSELTNDTAIQTLGRKVRNAAAGRDPVSLFMQTVFPFVKTPTLVMDDFWQRSPLNISLWKDMTHKDPEVSSKALARFTMGATYSAAAITLVAGDRITGGGPADSELRKLWKKDHQPYSIKIGEKWYAYNRFDPTGTHFGVLADMAEIIAHVPDREAEDLMKLTATAFARQFQNKTFLRGASDLFAALTDDSGNDQGRYVNNLIGSTVPSMFNAFKDDPYTREVRTTVDAIRNRLPGYSTKLDPQRDILGRPVMASEVGGWSPVGVTTPKRDAVAAAVFEAFNRTGETLTKPPKVREGIDWSEYEIDRPDLGRKQSAYDRLGELVSEADLEGQIHSIIKDSRYADANDQIKVEMLRSVIGATRRAAEAKVLTDKRFATLYEDTLVSKAKSKGINDFQRLLAPPK